MENVIFLIVGLILFFIGNKKSQKYEKNIDSQKKGNTKNISISYSFTGYWEHFSSSIYTYDVILFFLLTTFLFS